MMAEPASYRKRHVRLRQLLKKARENAGLSQEAAAHLLAKPQWFVSRCESGARRIDVLELVDFARIYGIDVTDFLGQVS